MPAGGQDHPLLGWALRYGTAAVAVAATFGFRVAITAWVGPGLPTYITFYPAVMVVALLAGFGPGLLATALTALTTAYWILPPEGLAVGSPVDHLALVFFTGMGVLMSTVAELYRRSRQRTAAYERELAVRASEARYRSYIEVTGQLGWTTNGAGEVVEDIPAWREFTGQTREEIQGWGWAKSLHPHDVQRTAAVWRQAVAGRQCYETEYRVRRHDGVYRHFLARGVPIFHDDGSVREWIGTCVDITERQQAEEAMRRANEDWEQTFNTVPDFVAILDNQHRVVRANRAMAERLGVAPEQCAGVHCYRAVHGATEPPESCPHAHTCRDGREHTAEVYEARLGGHFLVTTTPRFDEQGRVIGAVHVARDITHLKRAEEALRENREDLNHAQAMAHTGSWRLDVRRNELVWSDETHRIFGIPRGAPMTYETFTSAVHPEDRGLVDQAWQAALRGEPYDIEHRIVVDGEVKWVRERAELELDEGGSLRGGFGTVQDITDRKRMEAALVEAKAAAEAAAEAKGRFLANISHELRTPMNAILGMVDLAVPRQVDPTAKEFLETARNSADLLLALLDDLLDSAKIEAGKLQLEAAPFSLRRVLDQTTQVLTVRASEKGICFACRIPSDVPDALVGDQVRLRQVLLNLAGNGIKFTEQGEVVVRVELEKEGEWRSGGVEE